MDHDATVGGILAQDLVKRGVGSLAIAVVRLFGADRSDQKGQSRALNRGESVAGTGEAESGHGSLLEQAGGCLHLPDIKASMHTNFVGNRIFRVVEKNRLPLLRRVRCCRAKDTSQSRERK
jgi:hypothetical protein